MTVDLKEYIERLLEEREKQLEIRLEAGLAALKKADQYAQKEAVDARLEAIAQRVAAMEGNRIGLSVLVGWILTGAGFIGALAVLFLR